MATSRRNSALKFFVNGRRAQQLDGLADLAGNALSAYDVAVTRSIVGLKRRAAPAASREVRKNYNVKAGSLRDKFRAETGTAGRRGDRDDYLSIWASTRRITLLDFRGHWSGRKSKGATANISGESKTYGSAFIATVKGRRAIRVRSFESTGRRAGRGPLRMLYGPSPFEMLSGLDHQPSIVTRRAVLSELRVFYTTELRRQWRMARGN
jgi:hypothetical protein